jgi:hypothetical protein
MENNKPHIQYAALAIWLVVVIGLLFLFSRYFN